MSNVQLDPGSGGAVVRTIQKASVQYPVSILDVGNHTEDNNGTASFVSKASHVGMPIEGLEDDGNAVQGAPVLIGAKYSTSTTSATNGAVSTIRVDSQSNIRTSIFGANTDNGLSIDASGGITVSGISSIDYDTRAGLDNVDMQACVGLVVPSATGAQEVVSSSFVNRSGGSDADPTAGLNVSQIGAFFFDGDNDNTDETTNVAAFGIAIASATGPKAIGSDGTSTTYLPVSLENAIVSDFDTDDSNPELASEISNGLAFGIAVPSSGGPAVVGDGSTTLPVSGSVNAAVSGTVTLGAGANSGDSVIGTVKLPDDETIVIQGNNGSTTTDIAVDTSGHLQVDALTLPAITGWDYAQSNPDAHKMKVDSSGSVHITDVNTYVSNFDNAGGETANASSYGVVVPGASGPVVVNGDADGLNTKSMAVVQDNISSNTFSDGDAKQLRVDTTGALHVSATGTVQANSQGKFHDRTYGSSGTGSNSSVPQVDVNSYGQITLGTSYEVGRTGTLDSLGVAGTKPHVSLSGAIIDRTLEDLTDTAGANHADGDAVQLRVNDNGRLYVDVGTPTVSIGVTD